MSFSTSGDQANGIASSSNFKSSDAWISGATAVPSGLVANAISSSQITLNWTDNSSDETGFKIERSPDGSTAWTQIAAPAANAVSFVDAGLVHASTYYYRVSATSAGGDSAYTGTASATTSKLDQSITFGAIAGKAYGDAPFALDATASSGLTVSYESSDNAVATVAGTTVTVIGVGTATITASQSGDASYNAAAGVPQTLTVNAASQTITFAPLASQQAGRGVQPHGDFQLRLVGRLWFLESLGGHRERQHREHRRRGRRHDHRQSSPEMPTTPPRLTSDKSSPSQRSPRTSPPRPPRRAVRVSAPATRRGHRPHRRRLVD